MKNRNSRMREIAFHTLFCMVSMISILLTMQKKYTSENDPLQAQITMREFQFFESIIEKQIFELSRLLTIFIIHCVWFCLNLLNSKANGSIFCKRNLFERKNS
jgi:hypothetical protein